MKSHPRLSLLASTRTSLLFLLLCLLGFVSFAGSAAAQWGFVGGTAPRTLADDMGFPRATYYRVTRPDPRLCPSPVCGGVFVESVNKRQSVCADGEKRWECHAAIVDFSALGLSSDEEAKLRSEFFSKRALARGRLELADSGFGIEVPTLVVADAWRGASGTMGKRGRYWGVVPSGIACITFPCPTLLGIKLNHYRVAWLHSIDLSQSGAGDDAIARGLDQLYSGPGLIAFGRLKRITGPAGRGRELVASEFYTKVEANTSRACGGFTYPPNPPCNEGEFCQLPAGTCNIADLPGTCEVVPEACIEIYDPVCGCDGVTYSNDCHRQQARVALDHVGACDPSPFPPHPCGDAICTGGTVCCNPLAGICTAPGEFCTQ